MSADGICDRCADGMHGKCWTHLNALRVERDALKAECDRLRELLDQMHGYACECGGRDRCQACKLLDKSAEARPQQGTSPTERPCCVEAYARGYDLGNYHGKAGADGRRTKEGR